MLNSDFFQLPFRPSHLLIIFFLPSAFCHLPSDFCHLTSVFGLLTSVFCPRSSVIGYDNRQSPADLDFHLPEWLTPLQAPRAVWRAHSASPMDSRDGTALPVPGGALLFRLPDATAGLRPWLSPVAPIRLRPDSRSGCISVRRVSAVPRRRGLRSVWALPGVWFFLSADRER